MGITKTLLVCGCTFLVIVIWTLPTGQACTPEGLLTVEALNSTTASSRSTAAANKQWIFPSIRFPCTANVTGWVFTAESSGREIVCPTVELWQNMSFTPATTDYQRSHSLIASNYTEPEALPNTEQVYMCTLNSPIIVSAGTVVGFRTRDGSDTSTSIVQLMNSGTGDDGFNRNIVQAAAFFNTALGASTISGVVPLITPIASIVEASIPQSTTTILPSSSPIISTLAHTPALTSPYSSLTGHTISSSTPTQPTSDTLSPPITTSNPSGEKSTSKESSSISPTVVAIVIVIVILVVIAVAVLFLVMFLVTRHRRQISPQSSKTVVENGSTTPGTKQPEITRTRSKNNYTSCNTGPIYEDVDRLSVDHKGDDHDYDLINFVNVGRKDVAKSYEVPQTSPSKVSSNRDSLVYELPEDILAVDESNPVGEDTYDTPVAVQGPIRRSMTVVESGYDTPLDTQIQVRQEEESIYETPGDDEGYGDRNTDYDDVYPAT